MNETSFVEWVKGLVGKKPVQKIGPILKLNGFRQIASGGYKIVYLHPLYNQWVVKVYICPGYWLDDSYFTIPEEFRPFWLKPIYKGHRFIIQHKASRNRKLGKSALTAMQKSLKQKYHEDFSKVFERHDIVARNCGFFEGRPVVYDFCS